MVKNDNDLRLQKTFVASSLSEKPVFSAPSLRCGVLRKKTGFFPANQN